MQKESYPYTFCYCEENIYRLAKRLLEEGHSKQSLYAVFISNPSRAVHFYSKDNMVVWDYHVILLSKGSAPLIYDFDCKDLPFPCPAPLYISETLRPSKPLYVRYYRLVPVEELFEKFSSDRSHMIKGYSPDGRPLYGAEPPPEEPIQIPGVPTNLFSAFVDMKAHEIGTVLQENQFILFTKNK
eukprot:TRINITY_DN11047_c0_g1_i1.p1 TRINITY_DN11047_c0_g1~~TRINITY_DN11047_c0_g1_i1.p1  ORF type:complete len:184 (-),score=23.81 TRINITY_DN11047_c0_g1_i1:5-556(-)